MPKTIEKVTKVADTPESNDQKAISPLFARRMLKRIWIVACILLVLVVAFPVRFDSLRILEVASIAFVFGGALYLSWTRRPVRYGLLLIAGIFGLAVAGPGRSDSPTDFRTDYINSLEAYNGTTYIWGGETRLGIDCSGLMRCAYIDTCYRRGFTTVNPGLIRDGLSMWWNDRSAKAISEGYRQETKALFETKNLNTMDTARIQPGDMAVTSGGQHVMAYLGGGEWIEADPKEGKVIRARCPSTKISWFSVGVTLVRWSRLDMR